MADPKKQTDRDRALEVAGAWVRTAELMGCVEGLANLILEAKADIEENIKSPQNCAGCRRKREKELARVSSDAVPGEGR